jgi:hypothetical protein
MVRDLWFKGHHSWLKRGILFFTKALIKILRVEGEAYPPLQPPLPPPLTAAYFENGKPIMVRERKGKPTLG